MSTSCCVTVARNWASSSGKLAVYSSITMYIYSGEDPHLLPLRRPGESLTTSDNNEKAKILTERFFPQPALADLSDITGEAPVTRLRVDSDMTTKEIARTISRFSNNTVLGLDSIPNKVLKTCELLIVL